MAAYYNENDAFAAAWLRELIKEGLIADGEVDERSIVDVTHSDLKGFTRCHFFAGIGGWDYALQLAKWPIGKEVWTASPPCQDVSVAGSIWGVRRGLSGERTSLVGHWLKLVNTLRPATMFFENVPGISPWIVQIEGCLESLGYVVSRQELSAGDVGAPHLRRRVWMVADRNSQRRKECRSSRPFPLVGKPWRTAPRDAWGTAKSKTGRVVNGIPGRVEQVRAFGNSIVPQVAQAFIEAYMETLGE